MRPRVPGPTGMEMGLPVSTTALPRMRPSVPSIAMVRTVFSPVKKEKCIKFIQCAASGPNDNVSQLTSTFKILKIKKDKEHIYKSQLTKMLSNLKHQPWGAVGNLKGIENRRELSIELDVHHSTNNSHYAAIGHASLGGSLSLGSIVALWKRTNLKAYSYR